MQRALVAGLHLLKPSETDGHSGLSEGQCPQWSCRGGEGTAVPGGSERGAAAQPAGQPCADGVLSPVPSEELRARPLMVMGADTARGSPDRYMETGDPTRQRGLSTGTPQLMYEARASRDAGEGCPGCECTPGPHRESPKGTAGIRLSHKWWFVSFIQGRSSGFRTGK